MATVFVLTYDIDREIVTEVYATREAATREALAWHREYYSGCDDNQTPEELSEELAKGYGIGRDGGDGWVQLTEQKVIE